MSDVAAADDAEADVDAEATEAAGGENGGKGQESGKKKIVIIGAAALLVLLIGGGVGAYFLDFFGGGGKTTEDGTPVAQAFFYQLPEMTVNLASTGGRAQYLKVRVSLETSDRAVLKELPPVEPRIMDAFQIHLRELRASDLEGSTGIYRMKEELLRRVNLAVHPHKVNRVLFNEMLIQ